MAKNFSISTVFKAVDQMSPVLKNMQSSTKAFEGSVNKLKGSFGTLKAAVGAVAGAAVVKKAADAITGFAAAGDQLAKTSRTLGLTAESFQELQFAAGRQGMTDKELEDSFRTLNKSVGELKSGSGKLAKSLQNIDPQLAGLLAGARDSEEAFSIATEAVANESDALKKAALANKLFGGSAEGIIKLTANGTENIRALREESRKYGLVTQEEAEACESFSDAQTNLQTAFKGLKNSFNGVIVSLMKSLMPLMQSLTEYIAANRKIIQLHIEKAFDKIVKAVKVFHALWKSGLVPAVLAGVAAIAAITGAINTAYGVMTTLHNGMKLIKATQLALNAAMAANPVGLIVVAVSALIAVLVTLYAKCEPFREFVNFLATKALQALKDLLAPIRQLAEGITAAFGLFLKGDVIGGIKSIGVALLQFLLTPLKDILAGLSKLPGVGKVAKDALSFIQGIGAQKDSGTSVSATPMTSHAAALESRSYSETNSRVTLDFNNKPENVSVRTSAQMPSNITLKTGTYN